MLLFLLAVLIAVRLSSERPQSAGEALRQAQSGPVHVERVIDGDTLVIEGGQRVRLIGVDTPETQHPNEPVDPLGAEATQFVRSLVEGRAVRLDFDRERLDRYNRLLAYVWLPDGRLLNEELIRAGYSAAETRFPYRRDMQKRFLAAEEQARNNQRGRWSTQPATTTSQYR